MELYDVIFKGDAIYDMVFFSTKSVLEYPTLADLKNNDLGLYNQWKEISKIKYGFDIDLVIQNSVKIVEDSDRIPGDETYKMYAPYLPEFCKIVSIVYGIMYLENGEVKRSFKKITNSYEKQLIDTFFDDINIMVSDGKQIMLCGYNVFGNEIPLLIKRHFRNNASDENKSKIPPYLKKTLVMKPWDCAVVDIKNVWKFNGYEATTLMLIADFLGLKRTTELMTPPELSKYYWENINDNSEQTNKLIELQCATQANMCMQIINELRKY